MFAAIPASAAFEIYSDFPGGNIDIVEKGEDGAKIRQQCRNSDWWFYWNFGVRGAEGGTLTFEFADSGDVIGSRGPAASLDGGKTWKWLGAQGVKRKKTRRRLNSPSPLTPKTSASPSACRTCRPTSTTLQNLRRT